MDPLLRFRLPASRLWKKVFTVHATARMSILNCLHEPQSRNPKPEKAFCFGKSSSPKAQSLSPVLGFKGGSHEPVSKVVKGETCQV